MQQGQIKWNNCGTREQYQKYMEQLRYQMLGTNVVPDNRPKKQQQKAAPCVKVCDRRLAEEHITMPPESATTVMSSY